MNLYPRQYHLAELTAHVVALLERRRLAFEHWDEAPLVEEAKKALGEAGRQFREVADDAAYWERTTSQLMSVAMPRYLKLARAEHALEQRGYGIWRRGDVISRATYAVVGLITGFIILRTAVPNWLEPLPVAMFIGGPVLPELQTWWAKRKYRLQLVALVDDMQREAEETHVYQPIDLGPEVDTSTKPESTRTRD